MKKKDFNAMIAELETTLKVMKEKYVVIDPKSTYPLKIKIKILVIEYFLGVAKKINKKDIQVTKELIELYKERIKILEDDIDQLEDIRNKSIKFENKGRIYISGPISGHTPEECRKRFEEVEQLLIRQGYRVFNPMKNGLPFDADTHQHMRRDLNVLTNEDDPFDYIYMMKRWPHSSGCKTELDNAIACGISIMWEDSEEVTKFE